MPTRSAQLLKDLGLAGRKPPELFTKQDQLFAESAPQANAVDRVWDVMKLDGVLYVDKSPAVYLKTVHKLSLDEERRCQRLLWNHATAPLLILSDDDQVLVYSGQAFPADTDRNENPREGDRRLVTILKRAEETFAEQARQLIPSIETGKIYADRPKSFDRECAVDRDLLQNLGVLCEQLRPRLRSLAVVDALVTRLIFVCYLLEREIICGKHFRQKELSRLNSVDDLRQMLDGKQARDSLYALFAHLADEFNGTVFEGDLESEKGQISDNEMRLLAGFLRGEELRTGQKRFWAYDFGIIPIETISAIYEQFIEADLQKKRREKGAYYTPPHLAELVADTAVDGWDSLLDKKVLDPACGSGIFLVSLFNRMAEEWQRQNPDRGNSTKAKALIEILRNKLYGVDVNPIACRIACFSLYLALLDHLKPRDVEELRKHRRVLPPLLCGEEEKDSPKVKGTILVGNFFDPHLKLGRESFDLVIGNPPWVSRTGAETDRDFGNWCAKHPDLPVPEKQTAHGFMWEAPHYLRSGGSGCFVLPSAVLLNKTTNRFQEKWFGRLRVDRVVNLCDLRHLMFSGAKHPSVVVRFHAGPPADDSVVEYCVPKVEERSLRGGPVYVAPDDRKPIRLSRIRAAAAREEAPLLWKTYLWGTPRDLKLIERLSAMPRLGDMAGEPGEGKPWMAGVGFQPIVSSDIDPETGKPKKRTYEPFWKATDLFTKLPRTHPGLFLIRADCDQIRDSFPVLRRSPDKALFKPPLMLMPKGSSKHAFSRKVFCDFPVLFLESRRSIAGQKKGDADKLMFLTCVLTSSLAKYFLFHTSADWGTEREEVRLFEALRMPFPLPEQAPDPKQAMEALTHVVRRMKRLKTEMQNSRLDFLHDPVGRAELVRQAKEDMEPAIYAYYDIDDWEQKLIQDTVGIFEPSSTPTSSNMRIPTLQRPGKGDRRAYLSLVCSALNSWGSRSGQRVSGEVICAPDAGAAIVTLHTGSQPISYDDRKAPGELSDVLTRIVGLLPEKTRSLVKLRDLKVFDERRLHILKPLTMRYWTQTAALSDADEIAHAVLASKKVKTA